MFITPIARAIRHFLPSKRHQTDEAYNRIFSNVTGGHIQVHVPAFEGTFAVGATSHLLRPLLCAKTYEPDVNATFRRVLNRNLDFVDIGANIGLYTVLAGRSISATARILAIEPTPGAHLLLTRNITTNLPTRQVTVFTGVASDTPGFASINTIPGMEEYSSLGSLIAHGSIGHPVTTLTVPSDTLDHLVRINRLSPGLLKLDVEGAEHKVLLGASSVLQTFKPVIIMECSDALLSGQGASTQMVTSFLLSHDYTLTWFSEGQLLAQPRNPATGCAP